MDSRVGSIYAPEKARTNRSLKMEWLQHTCPLNFINREEVSIPVCRPGVIWKVGHEALIPCAPEGQSDSSRCASESSSAATGRSVLITSTPEGWRILTSL